MDVTAEKFREWSENLAEKRTDKDESKRNVWTVPAWTFFMRYIQDSWWIWEEKNLVPEKVERAEKGQNVVSVR